MRLAALLLALAASAQAQDMRFPLEGRWFVAQGGDTPNVNHHMGVRAQWYGLDLMKVGGPSQRELSRSSGTTLSDFYSWDEPVASPTAGEIQTVVDGLPDNPLGVKDESNLLGNHVVIRAGTGRYVFIGHLKKGTVRVKPGQRVAVGQRLGRCGNSGNSGAPHVHIHVQDSPTLNEGEGQNMVFRGISVELTGKTFTRVDWPLIKGLFVWNDAY